MVKDLNEVKRLIGERNATFAAIAEGSEASAGALIMLPIDKLYPHPDNPRKKLGDLKELSESIKVKGVMQNLTVVPRADEDGTYTIIIGHRRHAAAKKAGLKELPCVIVEMSEQEQLATMLLENIQRSDLTAYEQAKGFQMMMDFGDSVSGIVKKTGFSESTVRRRLKMAELDEEVLQKVSGRQISFGDIDKLSEIEDLEVRNKVLADIGTANFNSSLKTALSDQARGVVLKKMRDAFDAAGLKEVSWNEYTSNYNYITAISNPNDLEESIKSAVERGAEAYYFSYSTTFYMMKKKDESHKAEKSEAELKREQDIREREERRSKLASAFVQAFELRKEFIVNYSMREATINLHKIAAFLALMSVNRDIFDEFEQKDFESMLFGREREISSFEEMSDFIEPTAGAKAMLVAAWLLCDYEDHDCYDYYGNYEENEALNMIYEFLEAIGYEMSDEERELLDGSSELYLKPEDENE